MKFSLDFLKKLYKHLPISGIVLLFIIIIMIINSTFKTNINEGFDNAANENKFLFKQNEGIYDNFYADIYDFLVYNDIKDEYEIGAILNKTNPNKKSVILDVGCGTGHHVSLLGKNNLNAIGIDISPSMIQKAKQNYPQYTFKVGNVLNNGVFQYDSFTHILCLYFTIYYFKDKTQFFQNCYDWLMPGGYLVVHLVDKYNFDPILPAASPLYVVSPQKYAKNRITKSKITFNKFKYEANFQQDIDTSQSLFEEKIIFNDGKTRHHQHKFYMENYQDILTMAKDVGFIVQSEIDMIKCGYEYQYLFILTKSAN